MTTEFEYLLNAMENTAAKDRPSDHDYFGKRQAVLRYIADRDAECRRLREALEKIAALNAANDSEEGWNEWGEADCFRQAQVLARAALKAGG